DVELGAWLTTTDHQHPFPTLVYFIVHLVFAHPEAPTTPEPALKESVELVDALLYGPPYRRRRPPHPHRRVSRQCRHHRAPVPRRQRPQHGHNRRDRQEQSVVGHLP